MTLAFVTGASGLIGGHLVAHLVERGIRVRCLVRRSSRVGHLPRQVELVYGDLARQDEIAPFLADVNVVYHLAGVTKALRRRDYFHNNVRATTHLVHSCLSARARGLAEPQRLVYVSSLAAVGPSPDGAPLREDVVPRPVSAYGRSKLAGERAVSEAHGALATTIVRPPIVYGPGDRDFYLVFRAAARGWVAAVGSLHKTYSLIHVRDLVQGLVAVAEAPAAVGQAYFLAHPERCSGQELMGSLGRVLGRPVRAIRVPTVLCRGAGALGELLGLFRRSPGAVNRDKVIEASQDHYVCDVSKAQRDAGYRAAISLADGLAETAEWYRRQGWL